MGNERPGTPNYGGRPAFPFGAPSQTMMPSQPSGAVPGSDPSLNRPVAPPRFGGPPAVGQPPSSYPSFVGQNQHLPFPQHPSASGQIMTPPMPPLGSNQVIGVAHPPPSIRPQPQMPLVPMGPPPPGSNFMHQRESAPSSLEPQFPVSRPVSQPPLQQYPYHPQQGAYVPPPPVVGPLSQGPKDLAQGGIQGLVEEFQSLSVGSIPGSMDSGINSKSLPRPLDGDMVACSFSEMYPLNCHSRYLRLTTSAIPNSQSLLSRWHLPLGAVLHPLAEPPDGEEVSTVNFGPTGIIRCRRCRAYVNPYVTFTDGGRKWRCNICALFNDEFVPSHKTGYKKTSQKGRNVWERLDCQLQRTIRSVLQATSFSLYFLLG